MNLYHIKKNNESCKYRKQNNIYIDLNNLTYLGDILFIISNGLALSYKYEMDVKFVNNNSSYNILKALNFEELPYGYITINEPREYFYNEIIITDFNYYIKGKYQSYKYFNKYIDTIKETLFKNIDNLISQSIETFNKNSENKKIVLVYINKEPLIKESYYNIALNKFFINKNKDDYKIFIFTENININNWTVFNNYNYVFFSGNEEKLFLLMIQCDHFIITNSSLPLIAFNFRNNKEATITLPPIWIDGQFNYNDMIDETYHISIIYKLNNTHIINKENRNDISYQALCQLKKISYNPKIFQAHTNETPNLGYTLSHIDLLLRATEINLPYIVITDDMIHIENESYILYCIGEVMANYEWDVITIGENIEAETINNFISKVKSSTSMTFYIVHKNYYSKLLENFIEGRDLLVNSPENENTISFYWKKLQNDNWYTINKKYIYTTTILMEINRKEIIPLEYLENIPIFNLNHIKEIYNIHPFFLNYKSMIININCSRIVDKNIKYPLELLTNNEYDLIKLQSTYNEKTFNDKINDETIYRKLTNTKINYSNTAFLLNNNSIKKIINKMVNLNMGKLIKPIFFGKNDKLWVEYYNNINTL